jgi:hypothetical protein
MDAMKRRSAPRCFARGIGRRSGVPSVRRELGLSFDPLHPSRAVVRGSGNRAHSGIAIPAVFVIDRRVLFNRRATA